MATSFKKTSISVPKLVKEKSTPDGVYWKNLETPITVKEYGAITDIDFCPTKPHNFAVTNSMRVQIYNGGSSQLEGTVSRFKDVAYSGTYRGDGKLLVAGTEDKYIKLFNPGTRSLLRTFKGHHGPVRVTKFLQDQFRIISGSDDKSVRVWDIPTEKEIHIYQEHQDYIRCGLTSSSTQDIFLTGSYDHTVKLWDARTQASVLSVNHGSPVESVLMFPNGGIFFSAGGNVVKIWDALAGGKLMATLNNHHKTVTSLCFCSKYERFMSASLDKHVKVYDVASYQVVHTLTYSGPILSHAVSPDDNLLVVGMADKMLSIQRRKPDVQPEPTRSKKNLKLRGHSHHAKTFVPNKTDSFIAIKRRELLAPYDRHLKSFNHTKALDAALQVKIRVNNPEVTVSVMQELIRRGHIRAALSGRDDNSLLMVLRFIHKNLSNPAFMSTLMDVFNLILEIYGLSELMNSGPLVSVLVKIKELVNLEVRLMTSVQEIMGSLDLLFAVAENQTLLPTTSSASGENGMETDSNTVNELVEGHSLLSQIGSLATHADHMIKT
ncbi:U3 small nucleolar RNA-associated protein 15 homolog [Physella acuta]|uniref:U3 small nucleolar RNA-associated protein 15 homolog n=1 Tax=Physella acuta TaxID=109671 RepID=UPI0027DB3C99|nr:U3 small nucleolar RNA-associated protein 15 homolog [Physella acuta]